MKIIIYGDSFVFGNGLNLEYSINKGYIKNYYHNYEDFKKMKCFKESENFLYENRWSKLLEKQLNIKIENHGFPGGGWQYIYYHFFKNEINNNKNDIHIFCCPRISFKRLLIDKKFNNSLYDLNVMLYDDYNILNLHKKSKSNALLDDLFTKTVTDQLNFQNVSGIINYLMLNKKKFIFLPSWLNSVKKSLIVEDENEKKLFDLKYIILNLKKNDFQENKNILELYDNYVFKYIDDIKIENFWSDDSNNLLPSGHPNISSQEKIKNNYIKIINDYNLI